MSNLAENLINNDTEKIKEIINNEIIMMSPTSRTHYNIIKKVTRSIEDKIPSFCEVYGDTIRVNVPKEVDKGKSKYVEPDIFITCKGEWDGEALVTPPCLVVEVLSEATRDRDLGYKKELYERMGVKEYVIISQDRYISFYKLNKDNKYDNATTYFYDISNSIYNENEIVFKSDYITGVELTLDNVFRDVYK